jgi:translation initiation factor RLI1
MAATPAVRSALLAPSALDSSKREAVIGMAVIDAGPLLVWARRYRALCVRDVPDAAEGRAAEEVTTTDGKAALSSSSVYVLQDLCIGCGICSTSARWKARQR